MTLTQQNINELFALDYLLVDKLFEITKYTTGVSIFEVAYKTTYEHNNKEHREKLAAAHDFLQTHKFPYYYRSLKSSSIYYHPDVRTKFIEYIQGKSKDIQNDF